MASNPLFARLPEMESMLEKLKLAVKNCPHHKDYGIRKVDPDVKFGCECEKYYEETLVLITAFNRDFHTPLKL